MYKIFNSRGSRCRDRKNIPMSYTFCCSKYNVVSECESSLFGRDVSFLKPYIWSAVSCKYPRNYSFSRGRSREY